MDKFSYIRYAAVCGLVLGFWHITILLTDYWSIYCLRFLGTPYLKDIVSILIIVLFFIRYKKKSCFCKFTIAKGLKLGLAMSFVGGIVLALATYFTMSDVEYATSMIARECAIIESLPSANGIEQSAQTIKTMYSPINASLINWGSMLFFGLGVSAVTMAFIKEK